METKNGKLLNYIANEWRQSSAEEYLDVINPASVESMIQVPLSPLAEVEDATRAAVKAFDGWRRTPVTMSASCRRGRS